MAVRPVIADLYKDSVGAPGSIPSGGTTGQVLAKASNVDGDTEWSDAGSGDMVGANNLSDLADASVARTNLGVAIGSDVQAFDAQLTTWGGITPGANVGTALAVAVGTDGAFVVKGGDAGTPSAIVLTNATGTAASLTAGVASAVAVGGITGLGTNVATALAVNVGTDGAFVTRGGNAGTPSAIVLTNATGTAASLTAGTASAVAVGGITGLGTGVGTFLATPSGENLGSALTSALTVAKGGTGLTSGTSGGVLAFTAAGTLASSGALAANALVIGGGAGVAPSTTTTGTGVLTALAVNVGTDGAFVTRGGNAGTPSAINLSNGTALPASSLTAGVLAANVTLGESTGQIVLDPTLSADGTWSGIMQAGTAGATLAFGDLVYLAAADSRWELADADAASTSGDVVLGICVLAAASDGDTTNVLLYGKVRADAAFPALTIGAPVYVGTTAGDVQTTQPSGTDDVIRVVGHSLTADVLLFNPSGFYITHT